MGSVNLGFVLSGIGKRIGIALLAAGLASSCGEWTGCGKKTSAPTPGALDLGFDLDIRKLKNDLTVVLVEDKSRPIVSYQTWVKAGSVDEDRHQTGIAHLFEHLMFKGTEKYGPKQFFIRLETKGAEVNAYTTRDYTVYHENFTPNLLDQVIEMESDRLAHLKLEQKDLDTERNVVFEERRLRTDNSPAGRMAEAIWALAFRNHPYRWPVIGYPEDLAALEVKDLEKFWKTYYRPSNITLIVVGNIDADEVFDKIGKAYGSIPGGPAPQRKIQAEPEQDAERRLVLRDHVGSEQFMQAYKITAATDPDTHAIDVLANILFEGTSSRAYRRLVEERDILVSVSGSSYTPTFPGLLTISGVMKGSNPSSFGEKAMEEVLKEVREKGVSQEEVDQAVRQLTVQVLDGVQTPYGLAQLIGSVHLILGDARLYAQDFQKYSRVTPTDVQRVARIYLQPNRRTVVTLRPETRKKKGASPGGKQ